MPAPLTPRQAFLRACALDVAVRKPGNVSVHSQGHGMQAQQFMASASVSADAICQPGARVGQRIEAAVLATQLAVGCNTNLGILLLCAPLAVAAEAAQATGQPLRHALQAVLADLSLDDAAATFRAIARAQPGGLGEVPEQDVRLPPTTGLLQAMTLAADRDRIAGQYRDGYAEIFDMAATALPTRFKLPALASGQQPGQATVAAVQQVYLAWLASASDSHIVRKRGESVAQNVMSAAQDWRRRQPDALAWDADPAFVCWDEALKVAGVNPGTSADLTVATLMLAGLQDAP